MPKEQNVIKLLVILLITASIVKLSAQEKIEGKYSVPIIFAYKYYVFNNNGTFEYHSGASLGDSEFGKGHYQIKNDSLILNYDLTELANESFFKAKKYYNSKDSIEIKLSIYNFKKEPLYNIMVYSFPNYQSTDSNKQGAAFLKLKKGAYKDKIKLHVEGEFWAKKIIYLDSNSNYDIDIFMSKSKIQGFGHPKAIKNQVLKYKIIEQSNDFIKIRNENRVTKLVKVPE